MQFQGWAPKFDIWLANPPRRALRPINPDNAWGLCITATAGTELVTSYSYHTVNVPRFTRHIQTNVHEFTDEFSLITNLWFVYIRFLFVLIRWLLSNKVRHTSSDRKAVYNPKAFIPHAASLVQAFAHWRIFSTAATRRCLGSVSVPMLGAVLSHPLPVIALVSHYLTN